MLNYKQICLMQFFSCQLGLERKVNEFGKEKRREDNNKQNFRIVLYCLLTKGSLKKKGWPVVEISQLRKKESRNRYLLSTKLYNEPIIMLAGVNHHYILHLLETFKMALLHH
ncbi:hypothetical protein BpHYR1_018084 [Brachionus plicatilis]|uniref:Uncharacterized protein n=1 Tax=Brachionus plicatilis TaxID=10195 RepID=A0A3M7T1L8_BRAPC|nr:hypothetical protein BpHYR1_018084 [Brachionus plicatilis]